MLLIDRAHVKNLATLNQLALNWRRSWSNFEDELLRLLEPELSELIHGSSGVHFSLTKALVGRDEL